MGGARKLQNIRNMQRGVPKDILYIKSIAPQAKKIMKKKTIKGFPKVKKVKRSTLKNKADKLMSLKVRSIGYCQARIFTKVKCGGSLQDCHIIGRANMRLRYDPANHLCLCGGHHVWFTNNPEAWRTFIELYWTSVWNYLLKHKEEKVKVDYEDVIARLESNSK